MGQLGARLVQGLLGELAFRYVLKSADEHGMTLALPHNASHPTQVLHSDSRSHNPESKLDIRARHSARDHRVERRLVLGMNRVPTHLKGDLGRGIELEDTESLVRKVVLVRHQIRDEAARFAYPLGFGKTKVGLVDLRLRPFSIIDVRDKRIPVENSSFDVAHRNHADLKPAVYAIEPTEAMLDIKWLAFRDRVAKDFDTVGKIVRVNHVACLPLLCLLRRSAEILQKWSIEDLGCAIRRKATKKARRVVQERARIKFSRPRSLFSLLAIVDICKQEIPRGYLIFDISHWEAANLEPSVDAISAAATMLDLIDLSRFDRLFAGLYHAWKVVRMNGIDQGPVLQ